jgi:hypothetical protein
MVNRFWVDANDMTTTWLQALVAGVEPAVLAQPFAGR